MATTDRFKQIGPFISRVERVSNAAHLSWMKKFTDRVGTLIVTEQGQDCPAKIRQAHEDLAAAVQVEDDCFRIVTRSALTEQIQQADQVRDNTFVGLRTMVEALGRVGTAQQKEAATRVLQTIRDYHVSTTDGYELETTNIEQLIQVLEAQPLADDCTTLAITALVAQLKTENQLVGTLIAQRSEEQAGIDPAAMPRARQQVDKLYVEAAMIVNAFAITEQQSGGSPFDHAIDVINQDEDYYIQHVFPKAKLKKVKITDDLYFYFTGSETWTKAIENHPEDNEGWTTTEAGEVYYGEQRLLDAEGQPVDATKKVDDTKQYQLEQPAPDSDVTPVTPESL